jgi:hypothetical protein
MKKERKNESTVATRLRACPAPPEPGPLSSRREC